MARSSRRRNTPSFNQIKNNLNRGSLSGYVQELENILQLYEQWDRVSEQVLRAVGQKQKELEKEADRYEKKLSKIGAGLNNRKDFIGEYEKAKKLLKIQEDSLEYQKEMKLEQLRLNGYNDDYVEQEEELIKIKQQQADLSRNTTIDLERKLKLGKELQKQEYNLRNTQNSIKAREKSKENALYTLFGTNANAVQEIQDGTYGLNLAVKVFSKAVDVFRDAVKSSITANYNSTEKTLNSITASNRMSWSSGSFSFGGRTYNGYSQINNAVNDKLWSEGLYNNISNTDVIEAASRLTTEGGLDLERALVKGYEDTVIKYIVPYLDTASETFTNLEFMMPGMSKNVAAIAITTRDQIGESRYLSKYAEELAQLLEPVSLQASEELYSEEYQNLAAMTEAMLKAGVFQSPAEAQKYLHQAFGIYSNPSGKLSNGSTIEQWTAISALQNGDIDSPTGIMNALMGNTTEAYSWASGDSLLASIIQNAFGTNSFRNININNMDKAQKIMNDFQSKSYDELLEIYDIEKKNADNYSTNSDKLNKSILNATADIGDIKAVITDKGWAIGEVIVGGITAWLGAKLVGGAIGKMASNLLGSGGKGLMGILGGAFGGVAIGALSTAAVLGIATAISDSKLKKAEARANKELYDTDSELYGNSVATAVKGASYTDQDAIKWGNGHDFGNTLKGMGKLLAMSGRTIGSWFTGVEGDNNGIYKNFKNALDIRNMDETTRKTVTLSWLLLADYGNGTSRLKDVDMTHTDLVKYLQSNESPSVYEAMKYFHKSPVYGFRPKDSGGTRIENVSDAYINKLKEEVGENFHRQGLDTVPYDNYIASLHQGEAVLTASTANELRNLLDEYRSSTHISANLDVVIQQQTVTLCNKLDEVVRAINTSNTGSFTTASSEYQARAHNLLRNSMLTMTSTKEALN